MGQRRLAHSPRFLKSKYASRRPGSPIIQLEQLLPDRNPCSWRPPGRSHMPIESASDVQSRDTLFLVFERSSDQRRQLGRDRSGKDGMHTVKRPVRSNLDRGKSVSTNRAHALFRHPMLQCEYGMRPTTGSRMLGLRAHTREPSTRSGRHVNTAIESSPDHYSGVILTDR